SCEPQRPVPVLIHHGRQDEVIDVVEARRAFEAWQEIDGCSTGTADRQEETPGEAACRAAGRCRDGVTVEYCEGDFAHRWPAPATERIWRFFAAHPLPARE
ncbi:MAG: hypothetical protein AB1689_00050, partial [Thermodesulfobacteriota bacterium]